MRLLIKQRVFSWTDSYDVYDENENAKLLCFLYLRLKLTDRYGVRSASSSPFSSRNTRSITTAGAWKEISWVGIMMCTADAAVSFISPRNCSAGVTPIRSIFQTRGTNWRV